MGGGSEKERPGRVAKGAVAGEGAGGWRLMSCWAGEGESEGEWGGKAPIMMGTPGRGVEQTGVGERGEHEEVDDEAMGELGPLTIIIWLAGDMGCTTGGDMAPREAPIAPPFSSFQ